MIGKLFDRYMWVADLVIIAVFAAFLAAGVDHFLTGMIDGLIRGAVAEPAQQKKKPAGRLAKLTAGLRASRTDDFTPVDGTDILRRNIFDSVTGPLDGSEEWTDAFAGLEEETVSLEDGSILPLCTTPLSLQASYASEEYPDFSFVAIQKDSETKLLHVGEAIENYVISRITWRYAFLSQPGGQQCYLDLWREQLPASSQAAADGNKPMTPQQKKAGGKEKNAADFQAMLNKSIKDISPNEKDIDRELIEYLVDNKHMLMQSGRVLPNVEGDAINGFKVYGIRKTSLWGKLGIHNGDVVLSVNDTPMDGPDKAYEAFANLQGSDTMALQVLRHGKPQSFTYNIK